MTAAFSRPVLKFQDHRISPGTRRDSRILIGESAIAQPTYVPLTILHGVLKGPSLFLTAAVHGNELNGVEIIRHLTHELDVTRLSGTLYCIPVVNIYGFQNNSRYLPNGSDLNRHFPGNRTGDLAERFAAIVYDTVVKQCQYGIDLHTASQGRWNQPHIRGNLENEDIYSMATAFGTRVVLHHPGQEGSLRRAATEAGIPTILFEAGAIQRFDIRIAHRGLRGIYNVLVKLGMLKGEIPEPQFQVVVEKSTWIRAGRGGLLSLSVHPGDIVQPKQEIAVNMNPFGRQVEILRAPYRGFVIGLTTDPAVHPGQAVCHLVELDPAVEIPRGPDG